ncbi:MAG: hypothetical protein V2I56_23135 [Desulfobacteraceae bacterium]|nr:hypothetical protein [Desulfobacteraceae bacterium]
MNRNSRTFKTHFLWAVMVIVLGCANTPEPCPPAVYVPSILTLQPEEYPGEIDKYNKLIQSDLHLGIQQRAHLYLASLYFSPMNPNRDYKLALKHLETYALFDPDFANAVDPRLLLAAIIEIERFSAIADDQSKAIRALSHEVEMLKIQAMVSTGSRQNTNKENLKLKKRISKLQRQIRNLETSNAQLNKTIEMLSTLDTRLEEKRSNFNKIESAAED